MKKIIYLNSQTNEEVHYGEEIAFKETGAYKNGGKWESTLTFPVVNETIPMLIKKGVLVRKEVDKKKVEPAQQKKETTLEERVEILEIAISVVLEMLSSNDEYLAEDDE